MATNFPTSLDNFTNPTSTDTMDSVTVPHATQHANLNDAVEALEAKVGINSSAVATSIDYKLANNVVLKTFVDAKGDLITASAADTPAILARGTDTYVLQANNSAANGLGLEWVIGGLRLISQTTYTSSTTFTMPTGAKLCFVLVYCAGGGGGGGARNTSTSTAAGGGGGAGGPIIQFVRPCTGSWAVGQTITVTVGAGGTGGAGRTTSTGSGTAGSAGGVSRFVNSADGSDMWGPYIFYGGRSGNGGSTTTGGGGGDGYVALSTPGLASLTTSSGAGGSGGTTAGSAGYKSLAGGTGGGGGAGATTAAFSGNVGGGGYSLFPSSPILTGDNSWAISTGNGASGGLGAAGAAGTTVGSYWYGGGGGGSNRTGTGYAGGAGAIGGGGGGGGGANADNNGGNGGDGGRAEMTVWIYG